MSLSKSPKAVGFDLLDSIESFPQFLFGEHLQGVRNLFWSLKDCFIFLYFAVHYYGYP